MGCVCSDFVGVIAIIVWLSSGNDESRDLFSVCGFNERSTMSSTGPSEFYRNNF